MTKNQKIAVTILMWVAAMLISIVGVGWMTDETARQTVSWGAIVVATVATLLLWLRRPAAPGT